MERFDRLRQYLAVQTGASGETLSQAQIYFKPLSVRKNTVLHSAGETCRRIYFVGKGCMRTWHLTPKGKEKTRLIATEGMVAGALASFISGQPSAEFAGTLEDCELLWVSRPDFFKLVHSNPDWQRFYLNLLEQAYLYQNKLITDRAAKSAKERYDLLISEKNSYLQRLPNSILASYLDVSPETLSRVKSK